MCYQTCEDIFSKEYLIWGVRTRTYHLWGAVLNALQRGMWGLLSVRISQQQYSEGLHPFLRQMERRCNLLPVTTSREESDLFSVSTDFCRSSQLWVCLSIVVCSMLSCNVIRPLLAAHGMCSLVCLLVPTEDTKMILDWRTKAKYLLSLCVPSYIFLAKIQ